MRNVLGIRSLTLLWAINSNAVEELMKFFLKKGEAIASISAYGSFFINPRLENQVSMINTSMIKLKLN